jgi:hypothetical protein
LYFFVEAAKRGLVCSLAAVAMAQHFLLSAGPFSITRVSDDPGHAVAESGLWPLDRSQNCSGLPRIETPTSRRLLRRRAEANSATRNLSRHFRDFSFGSAHWQLM